MTESQPREVLRLPEIDSRQHAILWGQPHYLTSEPQESEWGQPSASRYVFRVVGTRMYGQDLTGVYMANVPSSDTPGGTYFTWSATAVDSATAEFQGPIESPRRAGFVLETEVDQREWLALSERSFDFWDNKEDALYDAL